MNFGQMNFMVYTGIAGMALGVVFLIYIMTRKEKPQQTDHSEPAWIRKKEKAKRRHH